MEASPRTAVAATANEALRNALPGLLAACGVKLRALEADGPGAWAALMRFRPALLVADVPLPGMDGAALVRRALGTTELSVRPRALLLYWRSLPPPERAELERLGTELLACPFAGEDFRAGVERLFAAPPIFPEGELRRAEELLDALGVPKHPGRDCLKYAALLCARDENARLRLRRNVYPVAAKLAGLTLVQAERAMIHSIDCAWRSDKFENQYRIFADAVDAARGQPTCGEMISRLADILRMEG